MNTVKADDRQIEVGAKLVILILVLFALVVGGLVYTSFRLNTAVENGQQALDDGALQREALLAQGAQVKALVEQVNSCLDADGECAKDAAKVRVRNSSAISFCTNAIAPDATAKAAFRCITDFVLPSP